MPRTGNKEKQLDVSYAAGGNGKWYGHARKFGNFYKVRLTLKIRPRSLYSKYYPIEIKTLGAPGWLNQLCLTLARVMISACEFEPRIRLCADSSEPGASFRFCLPLSLPLLHLQSVSQK